MSAYHCRECGYKVAEIKDNAGNMLKKGVVFVCGDCNDKLDNFINQLNEIMDKKIILTVDKESI